MCYNDQKFIENCVRAISATYRKLPIVKNLRWWPQNWNYCLYTRISAWRPDRNRTLRAVGISLLSYLQIEIYGMSYALPVNVCHLRFPTILRRRTVFPLVSTCCPILKKTWVITVEISLLSCLEAEINVMSIKQPVNRRHLWFPIYPDVGQSSHLAQRVAWSRKHGYNRRYFAAIMYRS